MVDDPGVESRAFQEYKNIQDIGRNVASGVMSDTSLTPAERHRVFMMLASQYLGYAGGSLALVDLANGNPPRSKAEYTADVLIELFKKLLPGFKQ